jgi:protein-disulfide isomerase
MAKAAVAAVALAVAVGGEASVAKALSEGGLPRTVGERSTAQRMEPAAAGRDFGRPLLAGTGSVAELPVADVSQRDTLAGLPAVLSPDGAAIDVGHPDAPVVMTLFEDFRCSSAAVFEAAQGRTLADLAARHAVLLRYVLESSLDQRLPGPGALMATNAARAALSRGSFPLYHALLFANQSDETVDGFTEDRLLQIADQVPGLRGDAFDAEVHQVWYRSWVGQAQSEYARAKVHHGTPSMLLNGHEVDLWAHPELLRDPVALTAAVARAPHPAAKPAAERPGGKPPAGHRH